MRKGEVTRNTNETKITVAVALDGGERRDISTGIGFFDHMLDLMGRHGFMDLAVQCKGDLHVDGHHTVEDVGIALGGALAQAVGDKSGIRRYASCTLPMDETLVMVAVDISGRPYLAYNIEFPQGVMAGEFEAQLGEEFFRALAVGAGLTLHINLLYGTNPHHILEAAFKAFGRALADAVQKDPRVKGVPSTKGVL